MHLMKDNNTMRKDNRDCVYCREVTFKKSSKTDLPDLQ